MELIELAAVPDEALPVLLLSDHLRLGSGFADDGLQAGLLRSYLRAALAAIEGRTGKALFARRFRWVLGGWRDPAGQALPLAPVAAVVSVLLRPVAGDAVVVDPSRWRLQRDMHRPRLVPASGLLPAVPEGGTVEVEFDGGFGPAFGDVPGDLAQAVLLLAAHYHEFRHDGGAIGAPMPFGVLALAERWRTVRVLGGGAA
jgi:uncharacterized phiE125 gp8 family phage protein